MVRLDLIMKKNEDGGKNKRMKQKRGK